MVKEILNKGSLGMEVVAIDEFVVVAVNFVVFFEIAVTDVCAAEVASGAVLVGYCTGCRERGKWCGCANAKVGEGRYRDFVWEIFGGMVQVVPRTVVSVV